MNVNQTLCGILSPEEDVCGAVMLNTQSTSTTVLQALVDAGYIEESCGLSVENDGRYFFIARDDELILAINHLGVVSLEDKELSP